MARDARPTADRDVRGVLSAYAALVRVPNLFTAPPDVLLGAALVTAAGGAVDEFTVVGLAIASVCLYAAGTTLNDYFDASRDARERPERPIPSGRVSRREALGVGTALLAVGVGVAYVVVGVTAAGVASVLALVVVLYDGVLKGSALGFLAMGATRALNVSLGIAAAQSLSPVAGGFDALPSWVWLVPLVVGVYIASVTYMAAEEATGTERRAVVAAGVGAAGAGAAAFALLSLVGTDPLAFVSGVVLLGGFLFWTGQALRVAYANPAPDTVGPAVGICVLALVVLDAAFAAVAGLTWTAAVLVFLVPALGLSRAFDVS